MVFCNVVEFAESIGFECHNPYFNRWFSAIAAPVINQFSSLRHNPYFNRWFSAIMDLLVFKQEKKVTILILIDGFLQYRHGRVCISICFVTILILIDGFLQL